MLEGISFPFKPLTLSRRPLRTLLCTSCRFRLLNAGMSQWYADHSGAALVQQVPAVSFIGGGGHSSEELELNISLWHHALCIILILVQSSATLTFSLRSWYRSMLYTEGLELDYRRRKWLKRRSATNDYFNYDSSVAYFLQWMVDSCVLTREGEDCNLIMRLIYIYFHRVYVFKSLIMAVSTHILLGLWGDELPTGPAATVCTVYLVLVSQ